MLFKQAVFQLGLDVLILFFILPVLSPSSSTFQSQIAEVYDSSIKSTVMVNGYKSQLGRFWLVIRKNFFTKRLHSTETGIQSGEGVSNLGGFQDSVRQGHDNVMWH